MNAARRYNPLRELSPGETAFDQCLFQILLWCVLTLAFGALRIVTYAIHRLGSSEGKGAVVSSFGAWQGWLSFVFGILLAIYWVRTLDAVIEAWSDPVAKVLRFSSLGLLALQVLSIGSLLLSPLLQWIASSSR